MSRGAGVSSAMRSLSETIFADKLFSVQSLAWIEGVIRNCGTYVSLNERQLPLSAASFPYG